MKKSAQNNPTNAQLTPLARAFSWTESSTVVQRVIYGVAALSALLFVLDFLIHRHAYAPYEGTPGFYALTGFLAFSFIVLGASALRWLIARPENYYAPDSVDAESYPESGTEQIAFNQDKAPDA